MEVSCMLPEMIEMIFQISSFANYISQRRENFLFLNFISHIRRIKLKKKYRLIVYIQRIRILTCYRSFTCK